MALAFSMPVDGGNMVGRKGCGEVILKELVGNPQTLSNKNPLVLSCGGIYIPLSSRKQEPLRYDILTTSNEVAPVKIIAGIRPRNILYAVMSKEAMN